MDTDLALLTASLASFFALVVGWVTLPTSAETPAARLPEAAASPA
jgi:hypothetical protein